MGMVVDQVRDKESEKEAYKMDKKVIKEIIKAGIKTYEGSDNLGQLVLVKVNVSIEVLVVMKMVLIEVDHAINVEGDREAAKVANLVHKELSDEVRGHLAVHHVGLLLYRLVYHLVQNHPKHHLTLSRCHKYSQAIWRSSVGLLWSPVVFISQKSVFSETPYMSDFVGVFKNLNVYFLLIHHHHNHCHHHHHMTFSP